MATVNELVEIMYHSKNDAWQDDAAEELARAPDRVAAEAALLEAIRYPKLNESLRRTCAESLATIWIAQRVVPHEKFAELEGMPRDVVEAFLRAAHIPF